MEQELKDKCYDITSEIQFLIDDFRSAIKGQDCEKELLNEIEKAEGSIMFIESNYLL